MNLRKLGIDMGRCRAFSYYDLRWLKTKAFRNGNWWRLSAMEKALFNAALALANLRKRIMNSALVSRIGEIASRMLETISSVLMKKGREKARQLLDLYSRNGVLEWLPQLRDLLKDNDYLMWLGLSTLNFEKI